MRAFPITAALVGTALTAQQQAAVAPGIESRASGRHYEVICHFDHPTAARQALEIVEATWPVAMRVYGEPSPEVDHRLEVHLYRDADAYVAAEAKITKGRFRRNLAFAHFGTKSAHVAVQPRLPDEVIDRVGLTFQTLRLLVHEAAHLARYQAMPNYRSHPAWFADGNATWIEAEVLRSAKHIQGIEEDPSFAAKIGLAQRLLERGDLPAIAAILQDETGDLEFYETYAVRWLFFAFMMASDHERALHAAIADMRRYASGDFRARLAAALRRKVGAANFDELDTRFREHIAGLTPQWDERGRSLETAGRSWVHTAFDGQDALAWRTEPTGDRGFELTGELTILADGDRRLDVVLGRTEAGWITVAFTAGQGVTVGRYVAAQRDVLPLQRVSVPTIGVDQAIAFRIRYLAKGELSVDVDGEQVIEVELDHPMGGAWGLNAGAGSSGIWEGVALRKRGR